MHRRLLEEEEAGAAEGPGATAGVADLSVNQPAQAHASPRFGSWGGAGGATWGGSAREEHHCAGGAQDVVDLVDCLPHGAAELDEQGEGLDGLGRLLSSKFEERERLERSRREAALRTHARLRDLSPLLQRCLYCTGQLPSRPGSPLWRSRLARAALFSLVAASPALPGWTLPLCADDGGAARCVSGRTSLGVVVLDALFSCLLILNGPGMATLLLEVFVDATKLKQAAVQRFTRLSSRAYFSVFVLVWALLPLYGLVEAAVASERHKRAPDDPEHAPLPAGDTATRALWLLAGPARAALMSSTVTAIVVILRLHSFNLKAIRAAARLTELRRNYVEHTRYFAALVGAFQRSNALLNSTSVRLQALVCVVLLYGLNNMFSLGIFFLSPQTHLLSGLDGDVAAGRLRRRITVLEELTHDGAYVLMALAALAAAAHITALFDTTGRALQAGFAWGVAAALGAGAELLQEEGGAPEEALRSGWEAVPTPGSVWAAKTVSMASRAGGGGGGAQPPPPPQPPPRPAVVEAQAEANCCSAAASEAQLLSDVLNSTAQQGGFRLAGIRVTFAWFTFVLTLALGIANFGLSNANQSPSPPQPPPPPPPPPPLSSDLAAWGHT